MAIAAPSIIVITGIMASGKSTIVQALAEQLLTSVHLPVPSPQRRLIANNGLSDFRSPMRDGEWMRM